MRNILLFLGALAVAAQLSAQMTELERSLGMAAPVPLFQPTDEQKKEFEKAEAAYVAALRKYIAKHPLDMNALRELSLRVPVEEAQKLLAVYAAAHPDDPELYRTRALLWMRAEQAPRMFADLEKMVALEPRNADSHYMQGVSYYEVVAKHSPPEKEKREYIRRGIAALDKALELRPDYFESMVYKQLLLRQQALLESEPAIAQLRVVEADVIRAAAVSAIAKRKAEVAELGAEIASDADLARSTVWRVAILQKGAYVGSDASGRVFLDRAPFTIRVALQQNAPVMLNAFDKPTVMNRVVGGFRIPAQCKPIVAFCGGTALAEGNKNAEKQLFLDAEGMHYLFYDSPEDHRWSRVQLRDDGVSIFDREVARLGDTPIEKSTIEDLYLLFGVVLDNDDQLSDRELRKVKIEFR